MDGTRMDESLRSSHVFITCEALVYFLAVFLRLICDSVWLFLCMCMMYVRERERDREKWREGCRERKRERGRGQTV